MHRIWIGLVLFSVICINRATAQPPSEEPPVYTVSNVLRELKGQWRLQYKIIDDQVFYDRRYKQTANGSVQLVVDTFAIHSFMIDTRGRTEYRLNWESPDGELESNMTGTNGSWDLKQSPEGVNLLIRDAYYKGCPVLTRRVIRINAQQLLVQDLETGDVYYFTKRRS
ncbi:MAG: hypothetical protein AAFV80_11885 [Bacteroidota bacterium]